MQHISEKMQFTSFLFCSA